MLLTREMLLKKSDLKKKKVTFEDGSFVYVREMNGRERDLFESSILVEKEDGTVERDTKDFRAKLAVYTVCDEEGNLILKPEDYKTLSQNISAARLARIATAARDLNKITEEDKENESKN